MISVEELAQREATAERPGWILIENDGALFRGPGRGNPMEVWASSCGWTDYAGVGLRRGVEWGDYITAEKAVRMMVEDLLLVPRIGGVSS